MSKSNKLDSNIQTNTTGRLTPCLQKKTREYFEEIKALNKKHGYPCADKDFVF